jgi:hypothetical protein
MFSTNQILWQAMPMRLTTDMKEVMAEYGCLPKKADACWQAMRFQSPDAFGDRHAIHLLSMSLYRMLSMTTDMNLCTAIVLHVLQEMQQAMVCPIPSEVTKK